MTRPTVLMVITDSGRRGAQIFASDLTDALRRQGHPVRLVALTPGIGACLDVPTLGDSRRGRSTLAALRREMDAVDVVVAHGSTTLPACVAAGLGLGRPLLYRQISDSRFWAPTITRRVRTAILLRRASRVVALWSGSASVLHDYLWVPRARTTVIANGVPSHRFPAVTPARRDQAREALGIAPKAFVAAYVGALAPEKGVDIAIKARRDASFDLLVVGDGPARADLEDLAADLPPRAVRFLGSVDAVGPIYDAADVVVLPSRGGDSMPAVLIEAGLARRPAIATPIDGIPEVIIDGQTGLLVPPNDPRSVATAIDRLRSDPELRESLGASAHQRCCEQFEIAVIARQWSEACCIASTQDAPRKAGHQSAGA